MVICFLLLDLSSTRRMTRSSSQPRDATHRFLTDYQVFQLFKIFVDKYAPSWFSEIIIIFIPGRHP